MFGVDLAWNDPFAIGKCMSVYLSAKRLVK